MPNRKKVSDEILLETYRREKNIWIVADELGMCGQSVWERLKKLSIPLGKTRIRGERLIPEQNKNKIRKLYEDGFQRGDGKLSYLCSELNMTKAAVSRIAKSIGLSNAKRNVSENLSSYVGRTVSEYFKKNGHPKGMLGKHHTEENKIKNSERSKAMWQDKNHYLNSEEYRQSISDRMSKTARNRPNPYTRCRSGYYEKNGKKYFMRSGWELNYARYLDFLQRNGEIENWEYETDTFWFLEIKRGVRSYTPDFKVFLNNGLIEYHEVKGWLDARSKTKIKRLAKYYPKINLLLIDKKRYAAIEKIKKVIPGWDNYK
jgi:hypothetical protein